MRFLGALTVTWLSWRLFPVLTHWYILWSLQAAIAHFEVRVWNERWWNLHFKIIVTCKTWSVMVNAAVLLTPYSDMANIVLLIAERASVVPSFVEVCFERWFCIHTSSRKHWVISAAFTRMFSIVIKILTTIHCCWYYQYTAILKVCVLLRHNEIYTDFSSSTV